MELKESYQDRIQIYFGLELGLQPHLTKEIPRIAASAPFDFLIGSTHVADHMDPYEKIFFQGRTEYEAYHRYFEVLLENLKTFSCFDTCGHIDYVVRYGPNQNRDYTYEKYQDILDEILKTLIEKQIGLECNTAGFKYGLGHPNPTEKILARYRELGGEILTLGSDAHAPEHIAYNFRETGEILKACGFPVLHYLQRKETGVSKSVRALQSRIEKSGISIHFTRIYRQMDMPACPIGSLSAGVKCINIPVSD